MHFPHFVKKVCFFESSKLICILFGNNSMMKMHFIWILYSHYLIQPSSVSRVFKCITSLWISDFWWYCGYFCLSSFYQIFVKRNPFCLDITFNCLQTIKVNKLNNGVLQIKTILQYMYTHISIVFLSLHY